MRRRTLLIAGLASLTAALISLTARSGPFDGGQFQPGSSVAMTMLPSVAHAGGAVGGRIETGSLDALKANRSRYELIELDFSWTSDGHLVCLHDWDAAFTARFGQPTDHPLTLAAFEQALTDGGPVNCTLSTLADWLRQNPDKTIVTDLKERNLDGLQAIATAHPDLVSRFLPQAYQPEEIAAIKAMGYARVIWTLYRFDGTTEDILAHLARNPVFAVTMQKRFAAAGLARQIFDATGVRSYVHTVNATAEAGCFADFGIAGIYTDTLGGSFPVERPGKECPSIFN